MARAMSQEEDVGIFERLRKNTIASATPASPRNQITTLRWVNKQKQDDEVWPITVSIPLSAPLRIQASTIVD
jgi:hypothetical protein